MWEKVLSSALATLAAMTCLMRGTEVGDILAATTARPCSRADLHCGRRGAAPAAITPREGPMAAFQALMSDRGSALTASMPATWKARRPH